MTQLDFDEAAGQIISVLQKEKHIVLATSSGGKVTARTMSHVNHGLTVYFQTGSASEKFGQIKSNPNIAFAVNNLQIEAVGEICGHPSKTPVFIGLYKEKHPSSYEKYTDLEDEVLIKASIVKAIFYKYIDGMPCREIVDVAGKKAYRE
ncbi:MAG: pyridoxamine 5'-phosphate oxidase family protein [Oscillospiraceae bacterium]|nr:pyridoxamine 5'-phosphate oxidase family protein [Oscillospiraceae bacterium]